MYRRTPSPAAPSLPVRAALLSLALAACAPQREPAPPSGEAVSPLPPSPVPAPPPPAQEVEIDPDTVPLADLRRDLRYAVDLRVVDDSAVAHGPAVRAEVTVVNASARPVKLSYTGCAVELAAWRDPARAGRPAWRSKLAATWPEAIPRGCPLPLIQPVLRPGERFTGGRGEMNVAWLGTVVPVGMVYADSLPPGRWHFDAVLRANGDTLRIRAGSAVLPPTRIHLGSTYPLDGFSYAVESQPGPSVHEVRVVIRNAGMRPDLTREVARDCPVVLYAYRSAEAQRTSPPAPAWVSPRACGPATEPVRLRTGESRTFTRRFTAREVLGDSLPPGRYFVTAIVPLKQLDGGLVKRVWLDTGAFDLR